MDQKRLLLVSHSPLLSGGAELSLLEIILYLQAKGHTLKVVLPAKGAFSRRLSDLKIPYVIVSYRWGVTFLGDTSKTNKDIEIFNADSILKAYEIIKQFSPDLVISNTIVVPWFGVAAKARGVPHAMVISESYDDANNFKLLPTRSKFLQQLQESIDYAFYNSEYTKSLYKDILAGTPGTVLYPAITFSEANLSLLKSSVTVAPDQLKLVVFGSVVRHKNQIEALRAVKILIDDGQAVHLTILGTIGSEKYHKELLSFVKKMKLQTHVTFLDHIPEPFSVITEHQVVIVPSLIETFGRVTVEAQLLGRVVIGANAGGTAELIDDMQTGLLYELGNADELAAKIAWVIAHPQDAAQLAVQAQKKATDNFITNNPNAAVELALQTITSSKADLGDVHFNYLHALIERNLYVNNKIKDYNAALQESIAKVKLLENSLPTRLSKKLRQHLKSN